MRRAGVPAGKEKSMRLYTIETGRETVLAVEGARGRLYPLTSSGFPRRSG